MPPEEIEFLNITPHFRYHRDVEILKRFIEQASRLSLDDHLGSEAIAYIRTNVEHAREAMSGVMADDVERQIQITRDFPRPEPGWDGAHPFVAMDERHAPDVCATCGRTGPNRPEHTL